jgi:hypothetical protein
MENKVRNNEELKEFALTVARYAVEKAQKDARNPIKEPRYKLTDPTIQENFPLFKLRTLQKLCKEKKIGKKGPDGYRVTLSEIDRLYKQE